jgi:hypothetical protein
VLQPLTVQSTQQIRNRVNAGASLGEGGPHLPGPHRLQVLQGSESSQFLGSQYGSALAADAALAKIYGFECRNPALMELLDPAHFKGERRDPADGMPCGAGVVILLLFQKNALETLAGHLEFDPRHTTPATAIVVGFLEPSDFEVPEILETPQAIEFKDGTPVRRAIIFQGAVIQALVTDAMTNRSLCRGPLTPA